MTINSLNIASAGDETAAGYCPSATGQILSFPHQPHKHRLKLEAATLYVYEFKCVRCEGSLYVDKFLVRLAVKSPGMLFIKNINLWWDPKAYLSDEIE